MGLVLVPEETRGKNQEFTLSRNLNQLKLNRSVQNMLLKTRKIVREKLNWKLNLLIQTSKTCVKKGKKRKKKNSSSNNNNNSSSNNNNSRNNNRSSSNNSNSWMTKKRGVTLKDSSSSLKGNVVWRNFNLKAQIEELLKTSVTRRPLRVRRDMKLDNKLRKFLEMLKKEQLYQHPTILS